MSNRLRAILINVGLVAVTLTELSMHFRASAVIPCFFAFAFVANILIFFKSRADMRARGKVSRFAMHDPGEPAPNMAGQMRQQFQAREREEHRIDGPR